MVVRKTPQQKLNRELRKAVHSGDGYEDYMTVYQFLHSKISLLNQRMRRMQRDIDTFFDDGGEIALNEEHYDVSLDGVTLSVSYDEDGEVTDYFISGMKGKRDTVRRIMGLFFSVHMMPIYRRIISETNEQLADLDNDRTLRGMSELRDIIRGDRYLTSFAVSGVEIDSEPEEGWD